MKWEINSRVLVILVIFMVAVASYASASARALTEQEYVTKNVELTERATSIMARFSEACTDFSEGEISLESLELILTDCSEDMNAVANEAAFLSPPPGYEESHRHWIRGINLYNSAMFEATIFFEDADINHIYLATDMLGEGNTEIQLAIAALPTPTPTPTPTTPTPGFEAVFAILGLLTIAYWRRRW